jgi:hypothetical protein
MTFYIFLLGCNNNENHLYGRFDEQNIIASGTVECCVLKFGFWNTYGYILFEDGKIYKRLLNDIICSYPLSMLRNQKIEIIRIDNNDFIKIKGERNEPGSN